MNSKARVHAALEGKPVDRAPVTVLYAFLYHQDHFSELTGREPWQLYQWMHMPPDEYLELFKAIHALTPFELVQAQYAPSRAVRENLEFVVKDGRPFRHHKKEDRWEPLSNTTTSGHPTDYRANETQYVFDKHDVNAQFKLVKAEQLLAEGRNDYLDVTVRAYGRDHFILSGGVIGTLYSCNPYVGLTNVFRLLLEQPTLIEYLCHKILEQNIETIRALAAAGGDAIYIDDATATSDMISPQHYERFSLPYMQEMVREIHRLGHKAIVIYFGGVSDRLEQIVATGADGFSMETSMKSYTNDIDQIARAVGDRITLFGNIDPVSVLQNGTDAELEAEVRQQLAAGRQGRGFVLCTGSPITPFTPLSRVQRFIALGQQLG